MRNTYLILLSLALSACDADPTKIGTACTADKDCNVEGQVCAGGICTKACMGQFGDQGCPIGFNCTQAAGRTDLTCNKTPFSVDATTGQPTLLGKSCAADHTACDNSGVDGAACRFIQSPTVKGMPFMNDPHAYCSAPCSDDTQCPFFMYCTKDWDGATKCLMRDACAPCTYDDNCNADGSGRLACVAATKGDSKYCTPTCADDTDCPGSAQTFQYGLKNYLTCQPGTDANGNNGSFCFHRFGACVGDGNICDPCRTDDDCALTGSKCITNDLSGERFCSKKCYMAGGDATCAGPNNATCDDTLINQGMSYGVCTGDTTKMFGGTLSCYVGPLQ
jgi:hypothetical protein